MISISSIRNSKVSSKERKTMPDDKRTPPEVKPLPPGYPLVEMSADEFKGLVRRGIQRKAAQNEAEDRRVQAIKDGARIFKEAYLKGGKQAADQALDEFLREQEAKKK
jgi:hypothetical protein